MTVDPTMPPVRQSLHRLPLSVIDEVSDRIDQLEKQGIIERVSASSWVSPLVVGRKRDGSVRLYVDMRHVNRAVIMDGYPLPRIENVLIGPVVRKFSPVWTSRMPTTNLTSTPTFVI